MNRLYSLVFAEQTDHTGPARNYIDIRLRLSMSNLASTSLPGAGGLVRAYFGKAKFGEGKIWFKILNAMENVVQTFHIMGNAGFDLGSCSSGVWYFYN